MDIDAGSELVRRIQKMNPSIGGFSGMVPFGRHQAPLWLNSAKNQIDAMRHMDQHCEHPHTH